MLAKSNEMVIIKRLDFMEFVILRVTNLIFRYHGKIAIRELIGNHEVIKCRKQAVKHQFILVKLPNMFAHFSQVGLCVPFELRFN
jgi:hypothetical protein